jgi:hypothetical protein
MKTLILAMLVFTVMQAATPVPRQAATSSSQRSNSSKNQSQHNQDDSDPTLAIDKQKEAISADRNNGQVASQNREQSVNLTRLPPITIVKDEKTWKDHLFDWGPWVFSLFLVGVGIWQVWLLFRTLGAIKRQADNMDRQTSILEASVKAANTSAAAARENVEIFINKERARLRVEVLEFSPWKPVELQVTGIPGVGTARPIEANLVRYKVSFYAPTPAFISESGTTVTISESGEVPASYDGLWKIIGLPEIISPDTKLNEFAAFPQGGISLEAGDVEKVKNGKSFIHFYGFIKYKDIFDMARETRFHFRWKIILGIVVSQTPDGEWIKCGPPEDNQTT